MSISLSVQEKVRTKKVIRRMEITLEKSEMIFVGNCHRMIFSWCSACGERTRLLPPEEIAFITPRIIYQWVENRKVYFTELPDGLLLVCLSCAEREKE